MPDSSPHRALISPAFIERRIYLIRRQKVMLDSDLAELYGVTTGNLNKAVTRNAERFPEDFMFPLTREEYTDVRFQSGSLKRGQHAKYLPKAFTEQGVAMLSGVLHSTRAVQVNVAIMRAFVQLREMLATHKDLAEKLDALEQKYDTQFSLVFEAMRELMKPEDPPKEQQIGFRSENA